MIKKVKNCWTLGSLNMIIAQRKCKGEYTPELAELLKELTTKNHGKKIKKKTVAFVCDLGTLFELYRAEMIDINHSGNRKEVWDLDRGLEFIQSWLKDENKYDPTFALNISKSGKITLCALDGNNRTATIIKCFAGDSDLYKFMGMLPKTFRGTLRVGYTDEENKNYTANCNNFKKQSDGEIMNVTPGRSVYLAAKYIESSSGLYSKKGEVYQYIKTKPDRFKHLEMECKRLCYIDAVKCKGQKGLSRNIFTMRDALMNGLIDAEAETSKDFYDEKIKHGIINIQSLNPNFKLDEAHLNWVTTMYMNMEMNEKNKSIKDHKKFVTALILKIDEIVKIEQKKEKSDRKKLLKTELSHYYRGEQKTLIKFFQNDINKNPKKYGLR